MNTLEASKYILHKHQDITPLKLQKLLYYLKVWSVVSSQYTIEGNFYKWKHGPVNKEAYDSYKKYGSNSLPKVMDAPVVAQTDQQQVIDFVLDCYAPYDAITLSAMSHEDDPWKKTSANTAISEESLLHYYSKMPFAKNFPFSSENKFFPLQTDLHYAFIFDMTEQDILLFNKFSSYKEYKDTISTVQKEIKTNFVF